MSVEEQRASSTQEPMLAQPATTSAARPEVPSEALRHRHLYGVPKLSANFEEEYDERASQWFELFVDLILVVAWTHVTDGLYESEIGTAEALFYFWLTMNVVQSGWLSYMHYQTRFIDESFLHTIQLFFFILGLAGIAVYIGDPEFATELSVAMVVQKVPLIVMHSVSAVVVKKARAALSLSTGILVISTVLCAAVAATEPEKYTPFAIAAWTVVVVLETTAPLITTLCLGRSKRIPINIDHVVDRTNAFIMITLGESLISSILNIGSVPSEARTGVFYACLSCVLLMAFSIGLLYYNVQPPRSASAYRRSEFRGFVVYFVTNILSTCILIVSVGVKHCMHAITHDEEGVAKGDAWMLFGGLALVVHLIFWLRIAHYGGIEPRPSDTLFIKRVKYLWWTVFATWALVPLCIGGIAVSTEKLDPASLMGMAATVCLGLVLAETAFTTLILNVQTQIEFSEMEPSV